MILVPLTGITKGNKGVFFLFCNVPLIFLFFLEMLFAGMQCSSVVLIQYTRSFINERKAQCH